MATTPDGEKIVQGVHVSGCARHQASHRATVEETHRQALQVLENLLAQVVHRFLANPLHNAHLSVLQPETGLRATAVDTPARQPTASPSGLRRCVIEESGSSPERM
jgi:hypothetical protein